MGVSIVHVLHGVKTPNSFYSQVEDVTPALAANFLTGTPAGLPQPLFAGVKGYKPDIRFGVTQLKTLFAECGLFGADLSSGNTDLLYKRVANKATRVADATTQHARFRLNDAFMYWTSLAAGHQREAKAEARIKPIYDGTNAPVVPVGNAALAGTPTSAEWFTLGPISINTVALDGVQDITLDLGVKMKELGSDSQAFDSFCAIEEIMPVLTIKGLDISPWATYGVQGTALTALTLYLRRCNNNAASGTAYVPDGTASHIKITATAGLITVDNTTGGGNKEASTGLRIALQAPSATTNSITIATDQAIT
jgi:hypothetical protein